MEEDVPTTPIIYDYDTLERKEKTTKQYKLHCFTMHREIILDSDFRVWQFNSKPEVAFLVAKIAHLEDQIMQLKEEINKK